MTDIIRTYAKTAVVLGMLFGSGIYIANAALWWARDAVVYMATGRSSEIARAKADAEFHRLIAENTAACQELAKK